MHVAAVCAHPEALTSGAPCGRYLAVVLAVCLGLVVVAPRVTPATELPHVPEGYTVEIAAAPPLVEHPTLGCFDEEGRLYVCESAGTNRRAQELIDEPLDSIRRLEDTDGDGVFDRSVTFADKLTFPQGCLWYRGALYTCSPPHIWKLTDTDGDGVCDEREIFVSSFGFNGNAADIHGPFLGIDGRIYWCDGRHGHEFLDEQGNVTSTGRAARIFSCRSDGSDIRTFCGGGMDNPVEIDWLDSGEMIGTVNLFYGRPRGDCLVHWVEGGVYPRHDQEDCIAEFPWTGGLLPEVHNYGHVAVSGMCRQRSNQLFDLPSHDPQSPAVAAGESGRHAFFVTLFNTHKVVRTIIGRDGATFRHVSTEDFITWDDPDVHPTDVFEDADGSLLVVDTGGWFRIGCPTSQIAKPEIPGAIYRVRRQGSHNISDPRGQHLGIASMPVEMIVTQLLDDPRPAVREQAIEALAQRPDEIAHFVFETGLTGSLMPNATSFRQLARKVPPGLARTNLVWAMARAGRLSGWEGMFLQDRYGWKDDPNARPMITPNDNVSDVTLAALQQYNDTNVHGGSSYFRTLISLGQPAHKRSAAAATARMFGSESSSPRDTLPTDKNIANWARSLLISLRTGPVDPVLEHSVIIALIRMKSADASREQLQDSHPVVRRAALIALDQMEGGNLQQEEAVALLDTDDARLQQAALEVITRHEGWADAVVELIGDWLEAGDLNEERATAIRALLASQAAAPAIQELMSDGLADSDTPPASQLVLLEAMDEAELDEWPASWTPALEQAVVSPEPSIRLGALTVIGRKGLASFNETLLSRAEDASVDPAERIEAFAAVAPRLDSVPRGLFQFLGKQLTGDGDLLGKLTIARGLAAASLDDDQLCLMARSFAEIGPAAVPVLLPAFERSQAPYVGEQLVIHLEGLQDSLSLAPAELRKLLERYPEEVLQRAEPLLKRLQGDIAAQEERLAHLMSLVTQSGDAERGRAVFFGKQAACSSCHRVAGEGAAIGPDLSNIGAIRQPRDLLEAIAFPSASFAREFRPYTVLTKTGRVYAGIIGRQTKETLMLRQADLTEVRIPRADVEVMRESDTSIMPRGLDAKLSESDLQDLVAYLSAQK